MKKMTALLLALLLVLGLAACGGASKAAADYAATEAAPMEAGNGYGWTEEAVEMETAAAAEPAEAPMAQEASGGSGVDEDANYASSLKIIKTGDISIESETFDETDSFIRTTVESYGGILAERSVSGSVGSRWAGYTVRVPSEYFDQFFYEVTGACTVTSQTISSEDVTERYSDLETQLRTNEKKYERLLDLMDKAETLTDLYSIESEIAEVEYEIDYLKGTLNGLDSRISYSTIYINLAETTKVSAIPEQPSFGASLGAALQNGTNSAVVGFQNFVIALAYNWFSILVALVIAAVILLVVWKIHKKRGKKELPKEEKPEEKKE